MINIYKQPESANAYANLFIPEISDNVENVCLLFIGHLETVYNILSAKPNVNFTVIDGSDTTDALPYIYNGDNLKERITFEDNWCEDNDTFIENLQTIFNNMSFDLIIANPPYGKQGTLSIPLINTFLKMHDKDMCILAPLNNFSKGGFLKFAKEIKYIEEQVFDVEICELCCAKLNRNFKGNVDKKDIVLKGKQLQLANALLGYNKTHEKHWEKLTGFNRFDPEKKLSSSQNWKGFCKKDATNLNAYNEGRVFMSTTWTPLDGVHKDKESWDFKCNFEHIYPFGIGARPKTDRILDAFVFETKEEKDNFQNWWYSCLESETYNKNSLCNCILHIIEKAVSRSAGSEGYLTYFPNLDWSRSWTDKGILKELGLPEDFLEKEE